MVLFKKKQTQLPLRRQQNVDHARASEQELEQRYAFRRNRTITGSASSNVFAATESGADLKSSRVLAHELAMKRRRIGAFLGIVLVGALGLYGIVSQLTAGIAVKVVSDSSIQLDSTYQDAIAGYLAEQPIERLRFLLNTDHLASYLKVVTPEVESVEGVESAGLGNTVFSLKMRTPIAAWNIAGEQRYVDASGVSFAHNYYDSPEIQVIDSSGVQVADGKAVASNRFLGFVGQVAGLVRSQGRQVGKVAIPRMATRQVEVWVKGTDYPIKMSIDRAAGEQVEDASRTIAWMARRNLSPKYIDVRVSGRSYYR